MVNLFILLGIVLLFCTAVKASRSNESEGKLVKPCVHCGKNHKEECYYIIGKIAAVKAAKAAAKASKKNEQQKTNEGGNDNEVSLANALKKKMGGKVSVLRDSEERLNNFVSVTEGSFRGRDHLVQYRFMFDSGATYN